MHDETGMRKLDGFRVASRICRFSALLIGICCLGTLLLALGCSQSPAGPGNDPQAARVIRVPQDEATIEDGLAAASQGDTVLVSAGVYNESGINMTSGVVLIGSRSGRGVTVDGQGADRILTCRNAMAGTSIRNITFTRGRSTGGGGAVSCSSSDLLLSDCSFTENTAYYSAGGGILISSSQVVLDGCVFARNSAEEGAGGAVYCTGSTVTATSCEFDSNGSDHFGGAICCRFGTSIALSGCGFSRNTADFSGGGLACLDTFPAVVASCRFDGNIAYTVNGGAIECIDHSALTVTGTTLTENRAAQSGGAIYCFSNCPCSLTDTRLEGNTSNTGGAVYAFGDSPASLSACLLISNTALDYGGGAAIRCLQLSHATVTNCTFFGNDPAYGGLTSQAVVQMEWYSDLTCSKSIVAYSTSGVAVSSDATCYPELSCTDLYANPDGDWTESIGDQLGVSGNISEDPLFCDADELVLSISADSPCAPANNECGELIGALGIGCGE